MRTFLSGVLGLAGALLPAAAHAAITLGDSPNAWPSAPPASEVRAQADTWAKQLGGRIVEVRASPHRDDFTETLVLVERDEPMPEGGGPESVLRTVFAPLLEASKGTLVGPTTAEDSPWVVRGTLEEGPRMLHLGVASDGPRHVAIVFAVLAAEQSLYRDRVEAAFETLQGVAPPLRPIGRTRLLALAAIGFAAGLGAGWSLGARRSQASAARVGGFVALAGVVSAALIGIIAALWLAPYQANLALEGTTPRAMAWAIAGVGLCGAAIVGLAAAIWSRAERPVQSAPTAGVFAERRAQARTTGSFAPRRHPDGASTLGDPGEGADLVQRIPAPQPPSPRR